VLLQNQLDVLEKQTGDQKQHITLLQNQIGAKDSQISLLQTEVCLGTLLLLLYILVYRLHF